MDIKDIDDKKVRISCIDGNYYEGIARFDSLEFNECEYGNSEESVTILNVKIYKGDIKGIELIDNYTDKYGLAEECVVLDAFDELEDYLIEEDSEGRTRLLDCLKDNIDKVEDKNKALEIINKYGG